MLTTRLRQFSWFASVVVLLLFTLTSPVRADEKAITLKGRVDASELGISPGKFEVRALRPQDRSVELGKTSSDNQGRFSLKVEEEALALYGAVIEAKSADNPSLVLEAPVLRLREAKEPIDVSPATTVEAAILAWKVQREFAELELTRPNLLYVWLRPMVLPKTRKDLKRAELALAKWAHGAVSGDGLTTASVLKASVGDLRFIRRRLEGLKVSAKAIEQVEKMLRTENEVAYVLMMPYLLEL